MYVLYVCQIGMLFHLGSHTHGGKWKIGSYFDFGTKSWLLMPCRDTKLCTSWDWRSKSCMCGFSPPLSGTKVISTSYAVPDGFDEASFEAELDAEVLSLFAVEPAQIRSNSKIFGAWWMAGMYADIKESFCTWGSVHWRKKWRWSPWQVQMHFPSSSKSLARNQWIHAEILRNKFLTAAFTCFWTAFWSLLVFLAALLC